MSTVVLHVRTYINCWGKGFSLDIQFECPKLTVVKSLGVLFFKRDYNILSTAMNTVCIHLLKKGNISMYNVMDIILR